MLHAGDVIKFKAGFWWVERVSSGSAFVTPLTGKPKPITTRKGITKMVTGYPAATHISADALVEKLDPESAYVRQVRRSKMAEATAQAPVKEEKPRKTQVYVRTEKDAKEMKGQGAVILAALNDLGQATVQQLVDKTGGQFTTRQDPARVVGYYLSKFKREGLAKVVEGEAATEEPATAIEA